MKTDRELLEKAAKVAGIEGRYFESDNPIHTGIYRAGHDYYWNPLISDSEVLQLAVMLGEKFPCFMLGIFNRAALPHVSASIVQRDGSEIYAEQSIEDDINAATRRAIVRAAAAIGEQMP